MRFHQPYVCDLTTLHLKKCIARPRTLGRLIEHLPRLTTLEYDYICTFSEAPLDCDRLRSALLPLRHTLKHLAVRFRLYDFYGYEPGDPLCKGSLGPLRAFDALISLDTPLAILYGHAEKVNDPPLTEMLPPCLQKLTILDEIWGDNEFIWDELQFYRVLRAFFTGEKVMECYSPDGERFSPPSYLLEEGGEPGWKEATPQLSEFVLDKDWAAYSESVFLSAVEQEAGRPLKLDVERQGIRYSCLYHHRDP
ncbi:unnamed protein product [Periconia digitata]|uniref:Uncharacterized protein n=1 Tax=Periconia digitata TaxID=1303443 RepID=A0A9W4U5G8_9PLEO|nr:unnamed protein product [Periconia digitata]